MPKQKKEKQEPAQKWLRWEEKYVINNHSRSTAMKLAQHLHRSEKDISDKIRDLKKKGYIKKRNDMNNQSDIRLHNIVVVFNTNNQEQIQKYSERYFAPWTSKEDTIIRQMQKEHKTHSEIGKELFRTEYSVSHRVARLKHMNREREKNVESHVLQHVSRPLPPTSLASSVSPDPRQIGIKDLFIRELKKIAYGTNDEYSNAHNTLPTHKGVTASNDIIDVEHMPMRAAPIFVSPQKK